MRQFTDSEMDDLAAGWRRYKSEYETEPTHIWPFEHGFRVGLDTAAAERDGLREQLFKATKDLKRMARDWREYAAGDYCQTYNTGMADGLTRTADQLDDYINDTIQLQQENQK